MTTPTATVPAAVTALRDVVRAALPEPGPETPDGVAVFDGPDPSRPLEGRAVTVAAAFEDDQDAVAQDRAYSGAGRNVTETLIVACSIYVGGGDEDVEVHRQAAGDILTAIDEALRDDPTLGDAVARAQLVSATWLQGIDGAGAGVIVGFLVELTVLP